MSIELKMPALSPTMEEGTLAKWLVKEGDTVSSGDILAEIETDKATMEFEAVDEGKIAKILVPEGSDGVKVGTPIAILAGEGEEAIRGCARAEGRGRSAAEERGGEGRGCAAGHRWWRDTGCPTSSGCGPERSTAAIAPRHRRLWRAGWPRRKGSTCRNSAGERPRRADCPRRPGCGRRRGAGRGGRAPRRRCPRRPNPPGCSRSRPAGLHRRYSARGDQAQQHAQDDRTPPDGIEAADPHIYLTLDANLDALLKLRTELNAGPREARGEAVGQRHAD